MARVERHGGAGLERAGSCAPPAAAAAAWRSATPSSAWRPADGADRRVNPGSERPRQTAQIRSPRRMQSSRGACACAPPRPPTRGAARSPPGNARRGAVGTRSKPFEEERRAGWDLIDRVSGRRRRGWLPTSRSVRGACSIGRTATLPAPASRPKPRATCVPPAERVARAAHRPSHRSDDLRRERRLPCCDRPRARRR